MKDLLKKRGFILTVLVIISILSIFVISPIASSTKTHAKSIKLLDDKKITVMKITAATAGASILAGAIPGDASTPVANQIAKLSSYLLIVIGAIFFEKILLSLTGYMAFTFIIPIACVLFGIYLYNKNEALKKLAIKLCVFAIAIFIVVPVSVKISSLIENTYKATIEQAVELASDEEISIEENDSSENNQELTTESNGWNDFTSKVKEGLSNIGNTASNLVEKGKRMLSNLIDAIAVLLITSCVIPLVVLFSFIWIVKILFNVNIQIPKIKQQKE